MEEFELRRENERRLVGYLTVSLVKVISLEKTMHSLSIQRVHVCGSPCVWLLHHRKFTGSMSQLSDSGTRKRSYQARLTANNHALFKGEASEHKQ